MKVKISRLKEILVVMLFVLQMIPRNSKYKYWGIVLVFLLITLLDRGMKTRLLSSRDWTFLLYPITYIICNIVHPYNSMATQIEYFLISYFLTRYVILNGVRSREAFNRIISAIILIFSIYSIFGIVEAFTEYNIFDAVFNRYVETGYAANSIRYGIMRGHGVCTISINNGILLSMAWAIAGYRLFNLKVGKIRWTICYILIGVECCLVLSRASIAFGVIVQCLLALKCGYKWILQRLFVGVLLVTPVILLMSNKLTQFISAIVQMFLPILAVFNDSFYKYINTAEGIGSIGQRLSLWGYIFDSVKDKILFGWGYSAQFSVMIGNFNKTSIEVHWLMLLFQAGLVGMAGFICYQGGCLKSICATKTSIGEYRVEFSYVMLIVTVGYFVVLFTCAGFEDLQMFYLLMALFEAYKCLENEHPVKYTKEN